MGGKSEGHPNPKPVHGPPETPLAHRAHLPLKPRHLPLSGAQQASSATAAGELDSFKIIEDTVMDSAVVAFRNEIIDAMVEFGLDVDDGRLDLLAAFVSSILDAEPMLGSLGEQIEAADRK